jgi:hypothetical protein
MEVERMMARLLAGMKAEIRMSQAKMDASLKEIKEEMMARLEAKIEASNEKVKTIQEKIVCNHEELMAIMKDSQERMETNQEKLKAMDLEENPEEIEATVKTVGALKDHSGDQCLVIGSCRWLTRCAVPTLRKDHRHKGPMIEKR